MSLGTHNSLKSNTVYQRRVNVVGQNMILSGHIVRSLLRFTEQPQDSPLPTQYLAKIVSLTLANTIPISEGTYNPIMLLWLSTTQPDSLMLSKLSDLLLN